MQIVAWKQIAICTSPFRHHFYTILKFKYSEKVTQFGVIFLMILTLLSIVDLKLWVRLQQIFVAFSENLSFTTQ